MSTEGAVERLQVIGVLKSACENAGFSVYIHKDDDGCHVLTLVKDGIPEVITLPAKVPRRMLHRLADRYGVKIEWFYYANIVSGPTTRQ